MAQNKLKKNNHRKKKKITKDKQQSLKTRQKHRAGRTVPLKPMLNEGKVVNNAFIKRKQRNNIKTKVQETPTYIKIDYFNCHIPNLEQDI